MKLKLNSLLLIITMAAQASAYDLRPSKIAKYFKEDVHELLSIATVQCKEAMGKSPTLDKDWNCLPEHMNFATDYANGRWAALMRGQVVEDDLLEIQYLLAGVKWPDDPIGTASSNVPVRLGVHFAQCKGWLKGDWLRGNYGQCANRFCLSHYGHLQMAHSMKPWAPWCQNSNPNSSTCRFAQREPDGTMNWDTKGAIEDWVRFLVKVGKGVDPTAEVLKDDLAKSFFDKNCKQVHSAAFDYRSLFFTDCTKSKSILKLWKWGELECPPMPPEIPGDLSAQLKARAKGAILHLIQDSYARGHTLRVATKGTNACSPRISCTKITKFSDYTQQSFTKHGRADKSPQWDPSCFQHNREVDDPITAGAKVLAMFEKGSSADDIWTYLAGKVFNEETLHKTDQVLSQEDEKKKKAIEEAISRDRECFGK